MQKIIITSLTKPRQYIEKSTDLDEYEALHALSWISWLAFTLLFSVPRSTFARRLSLGGLLTMVEHIMVL